MRIKLDRLRPFTRLTIVALGAAMALGACTTEAVDDDDEPQCGDGEVNGGDECDGTDLNGATCASSGFDDGALSCSSACTLDTTQCFLLDEDQDELSIHDELYWGTDPTNPDTDGDGILDGVEYHNGADPLLPESWPGHVGIWPNRSEAAVAAGVTATTNATFGFEVGDIIADQQWVDQNGNPVTLHQFYGYVTVLSFGARWCPPCRQAAETSQHLLLNHLDDEVIMVEQLINGLSTEINATVDDAKAWVDAYGIMYPVVVSELGTPLLSEAVPTYYILDRELRVVQIFEGFPGDFQLGLAINAAVAQAE